MDRETVRELLNLHRGKALGIVFGLLFGWFAIVYGLVKAFFVAVCVGAGYFIGRGLDEDVNFKDIWDKLFKGR